MRRIVSTDPHVNQHKFPRYCPVSRRSTDIASSTVLVWFPETGSYLKAVALPTELRAHLSLLRTCDITISLKNGILVGGGVAELVETLSLGG